MLFRLAQASTPDHMDKTTGKLALELPLHRPGLFFDSMGKVADVCAINECNGRLMQWADETEPDWPVAMPWPNNRGQFPMPRGNGFTWNGTRIADRWPRGKITATINTGTGDRQIYLPIVPFRALGTKVTVPIINVHAPRKDDDPDGNQRVHRRASARAARIYLWQRRCVVTGDSNNVAALEQYRNHGFRTHHDGVGFFAWKGVQLTNFQSIKAGVLGVWSDHPLLVADVVAR